jgi:hypothetical protein
VRTRRALPFLVLLGVALAVPAGAAASAYTAVERVYAATGAIPPCRFSSATLAAALRETPTYDLEYSGDFPASIQNALSARAAGACSPHRTGARVIAPAGPPPAAPRPPSSVTAATGSAPPWPLVLAAAVLAAALLLGAGAALAGLTGFDPSWAQALRHSWREAGWRLSRSR